MFNFVIFSCLGYDGACAFIWGAPICAGKGYKSENRTPRSNVPSLKSGTPFCARGVLAGRYQPGKVIFRGGNIMKGGTLINNKVCLLRVFSEQEIFSSCERKAYFSEQAQ